MRQFVSLIMAIAAGGALLAPLGYAVATLRGMQHKKVYPLLRYRDPDGRISTMQTPALS